MKFFDKIFGKLNKSKYAKKQCDCCSLHSSSKNCGTSTTSCGDEIKLKIESHVIKEKMGDIDLEKSESKDCECHKKTEIKKEAVIEERQEISTQEIVKEEVVKSELCSHENCEKLAKKRGMCEKHYFEYYKRVIEPTKPICIIEGCTKHSRSRGLCKNHYDYLQKRGVFKKFSEGLKPGVINEIYYEFSRKTK